MPSGHLIGFSKIYQQAFLHLDIEDLEYVVALRIGRERSVRGRKVYNSKVRVQRIKVCL